MKQRKFEAIQGELPAHIQEMWDNANKHPDGPWMLDLSMSSSHLTVQRNGVENYRL